LGGLRFFIKNFAQFFAGFQCAADSWRECVVLALWGKSAAAVIMAILCGGKIFLFVFCMIKNLFSPVAGSFVLLPNVRLLAHKKFFFYTA